MSVKAENSPNSTEKEFLDEGYTLLFVNSSYSKESKIGSWCSISVSKLDVIIAQQLSGVGYYDSSNRPLVEGMLKGFESLTWYNDKIMIISNSDYIVQGAVTWVDGWHKSGKLHKKKHSDLWLRFVELKPAFTEVNGILANELGVSKYNEISSSCANRIRKDYK